MEVEGVKLQAWRISDFTKKFLDDLSVEFPDEEISYHFNTIDGWFKSLEKKGIHYVNRDAGEKIYDELDLKIAKFIYYQRREKFSLEQIFKVLPSYIETRPFPPDEEVIELPKSYEEMIAKIKKDIYSDIGKEVERVVESRVQEKLSSYTQEMQKLLPSPEEQRAERFNVIMTNHKITKKLQKEAIEKWEAKPIEERMTKIGWFRKVEDTAKKESFIQNYINEHFERALKEEFGVENDE